MRAQKGAPMTVRQRAWLNLPFDLDEVCPDHAADVDTLEAAGVWTSRGSCKNVSHRASTLNLTDKAGLCILSLVVAIMLWF